MKDKDIIETTREMLRDIDEEIELEDSDFDDSPLSYDDTPQKFTFGKTNRDEFTELGEFCNRYTPCPICYKCRVKASHLFAKCEECPIPICVHEDRHINMLIKRKNFAQTVSEELINVLDEKAKELGV